MPITEAEFRSQVRSSVMQAIMRNKGDLHLSDLATEAEIDPDRMREITNEVDAPTFPEFLRIIKAIGMQEHNFLLELAEENPIFGVIAAISAGLDGSDDGEVAGTPTGGVR